MFHSDYMMPYLLAFAADFIIIGFWPELLLAAPCLFGLN